LDKIEIISKNLEPFSERLEKSANAAVAIILKALNSNIYLLVVKRAISPRDPWSGHFSLPGGKRELRDGSLLETVMREVNEETGIDLREGVLLGVVEPERSKSNPNIIVLPFVFLLKNEVPINLNKRELESYVWAPLDALLVSERTIKIGSQEHQAFVIDDMVIWGLTYRILRKIFKD